MGKTAQYAWFFICYTLLNAVFYTANNIAYAALTSLVTKNSKERVQMGSFRFMFSFGTNLAIQSITVGAVELLGNGAAAWRIIALIYCVIGIITNTLAVFSVKELPEEELKSNGSMGIEDDKLSFKQTVKLLFENKYFSMICVIYILQQLRAAMVNVGIFFMTYVLLNKNLFGVFSWANNIPLIITNAGSKGKWNVQAEQIQLCICKFLPSVGSVCRLYGKYPVDVVIYRNDLLR